MAHNKALWMCLRPKPNDVKRLEQLCHFTSLSAAYDHLVCPYLLPFSQALLLNHSSSHAALLNQTFESDKVLKFQSKSIQNSNPDLNSFFHLKFVDLWSRCQIPKMLQMS
jgi:hypothetical protein